MEKTLRTLATLALIGTLCQSPASAETLIEGIGEVGGGIFLPTGSEGEVARTSPALQLVASLGFKPHLGVEAEFLYVPILLKSKTHAPIFFDPTTEVYRRSSQISAVAGLRFTSGLLVNGSQPAVGYLSVRTGFARIVTRTAKNDDVILEGSWIGRSVNEIQPKYLEAETDETITVRQEGFVLSPKAGILLRVADRAALDLAFSPIFIIDQNKVSTQLFFTISFALSAWQTF